MPYTFNRLLKEGYWFLYYAFAYHLPGHKVPFWGKFSSHLRSYLLRKVFPIAIISSMSGVTPISGTIASKLVNVPVSATTSTYKTPI